MPLIIETGSGVVGANSYATVAQLVDYAALRGIVNLPLAVADREVLLIKAMDFIEARTGHFQGARRVATQALSWPRYGVWLHGDYVAEQSIPAILVEAQVDIASRSVGMDLMPTAVPSDKGAVTQETVGPLSISYAEPQHGTSSLPSFPKAQALLLQLYRYQALAARKA